MYGIQPDIPCLGDAERLTLDVAMLVLSYR